MLSSTIYNNNVNVGANSVSMEPSKTQLESEEQKWREKKNRKKYWNITETALGYGMKKRMYKSFQIDHKVFVTVKIWLINWFWFVVVNLSIRCLSSFLLYWYVMFASICYFHFHNEHDEMISNERIHFIHDNFK